MIEKHLRGMDRQQVMAIFFTILMLGSMLAYGAVLI